MRAPPAWAKTFLTWFALGLLVTCFLLYQDYISQSDVKNIKDHVSSLSIIGRQNVKTDDDGNDNAASLGGFLGSKKDDKKATTKNAKLEPNLKRPKSPPLGVFEPEPEQPVVKDAKEVKPKNKRPGSWVKNIALFNEKDGKRLLPARPGSHRNGGKLDNEDGVLGGSVDADVDKKELANESDGADADMEESAGVDDYDDAHNQSDGADSNEDHAHEDMKHMEEKNIKLPSYGKNPNLPSDDNGNNDEKSGADNPESNDDFMEDGFIPLFGFGKGKEIALDDENNEVADIASTNLNNGVIEMLTDPEEISFPPAFRIAKENLNMKPLGEIREEVGDKAIMDVVSFEGVTPKERGTSTKVQLTVGGVKVSAQMSLWGVNEGCERKSYRFQVNAATLRFVDDTDTKFVLKDFVLNSLCADAGMFRYHSSLVLLREMNIFKGFFKYILFKRGRTNHRGVYLMVETPLSISQRDSPHMTRLIQRQNAIGLNMEEWGQKYVEVKDREQTETGYFWPKDASSNQKTKFTEPYFDLFKLPTKYSGRKLQDVLYKNMDYGNYMKWLAFNSIVMNGDYQDEVFFYDDIAREGVGKVYFKMVPWDFDDILQKCHHNGASAKRDPLLFCAESELDTPILSTPIIRARYRSILLDLLSTTLSPGAFDMAVKRSVAQVLHATSIDQISKTTFRATVQSAHEHVEEYMNDFLEKVRARMRLLSQSIAAEIYMRPTPVLCLELPIEILPGYSFPISIRHCDGKRLLSVPRTRVRISLLSTGVPALGNNDVGEDVRISQRTILFYGEGVATLHVDNYIGVLLVRVTAEDDEGVFGDSSIIIQDAHTDLTKARPRQVLKEGDLTKPSKRGWGPNEDIHINHNMVLSKGRLLVIKEGTNVYIKSGVNFFIHHGSLVDIRGTARNPVIFTGDGWGSFQVSDNANLKMNHAWLVGGGLLKGCIERHQEGCPDAVHLDDNYFYANVYIEHATATFNGGGIVGRTGRANEIALIVKNRGEANMNDFTIAYTSSALYVHAALVRWKGGAIMNIPGPMHGLYRLYDAVRFSMEHPNKEKSILEDLVCAEGKFAVIIHGPDGNAAHTVTLKNNHILDNEAMDV